jgi:outer membrane protein assembly factor BamE (lipoprotein component of BamABCDE complex)
MATACQSPKNITQRERISFQEIEKGMTPKEVRKTLGAPVRTIRENGQIRWMVYEDDDYQYRVYVQEGLVTAIPGRRGPAAPLDTP